MSELQEEVKCLAVVMWNLARCKVLRFDLGTTRIISCTQSGVFGLGNSPQAVKLLILLIIALLIELITQEG